MQSNRVTTPGVSSIKTKGRAEGNECYRSAPGWGSAIGSPNPLPAQAGHASWFMDFTYTVKMNYRYTALCLPFFWRVYLCVWTFHFVTPFCCCCAVLWCRGIHHSSFALYTAAECIRILIVMRASSNFIFFWCRWSADGDFRLGTMVYI